MRILAPYRKKVKLTRHLTVALPHSSSNDASVATVTAPVMVTIATAIITTITTAVTTTVDTTATSDTIITIGRTSSADDITIMAEARRCFSTYFFFC